MWSRVRSEIGRSGRIRDCRKRSVSWVPSCEGIRRVRAAPSLREKNETCVKVRRCVWEISNKTVAICQAYTLALQTYKIEGWILNRHNPSFRLSFASEVRSHRTVTNCCASAFSLSCLNRFLGHILCESGNCRTIFRGFNWPSTQHVGDEDLLSNGWDATLVFALNRDD